MSANQDHIIRQMVDDLREIVFRTDAEGRWTFLNAAWTEITGYPAAKSIGKVFLDYVHPEDRQGNLARFQPLLEGRKEYCRHEVRYVRVDGSPCWMEVHARAILDDSGAFAGTCGTISDIDDRHEANDALRRREAVLQAIGSFAQTFLQGEDWESAIPSSLERLGSAAGADAVVVLARQMGPKGECMISPRQAWIRPGAAILTGREPVPAMVDWEQRLERGEVIAGDVLTFPSHQRALMERLGFRHIAILPILAGDVLWGNMTFARSSDPAWSTATVEGLRGAAGIVGAAIRQSMSQETLRLAHEELERRVVERTAELERSERRFHAIFDQAPIGMVLADDEGRITFANGSFQRMVERTAEELEGMRALDITHPGDQTASARIIRAARGADRKVGQIEKRYLAKSGREVFARTTVANLSFDRDEGNLNLAMVEDVSERKILEEQFLQAQKMEAMGRLTGGISHDFNNVLTVIKGYGELLEKALQADPRALRKASQIVKATERASSMVNQLLAFSRKKAVEPIAMDVNASLTEMRGMLRQLVREDIDLCMHLSPVAGTVKMDPGQFGQLVMNLVVNARDAIAGSGRVTIEARTVAVDDGTRLKSTMKLGEYTLLEVKDSGCGMSPEVRSRIFEPFFTTKDVGKGTGLGLSTVYGIVQQAGGSITVESAPGAGTTFHIYLPVTTENDPALDPDLARFAKAVGAETILVVEDEDDVRNVMADVLRDCGYTVMEARDGVEALEIAGRHGAHVDLLLTDVYMPKMGGPELWDHLWDRFPDMRFLFTSGHAEPDLDHDPTLLHKPFSSAELTARVREILDTPQPAGLHAAVRTQQTPR